MAYTEVKRETQAVLTKLQNSDRCNSHHPHGVGRIEYEIPASVILINYRRYWVSHTIITNNYGTEVYEGYNLYTAIVDPDSILGHDHPDTDYIFLKHIRCLDTVANIQDAGYMIDTYAQDYRLQLEMEDYDIENEL